MKIGSKRNQEIVKNRKIRNLSIKVSNHSSLATCVFLEFKLNWVEITKKMNEILLECEEKISARFREIRVYLF